MLRVLLPAQTPPPMFDHTMTHCLTNTQVRIKLKAYNVSLLQQSVESILNAATSSGATIAGPVPLPTRRRIYTVLRYGWGVLFVGIQSCDMVFMYDSVGGIIDCAVVDTATTNMCPMCEHHPLHTQLQPTPPPPPHPINSSPNNDKDSREQFEIRTHSRLIDVKNLSEDTINKLLELDLPAGVDVDVKLNP